LRERGHDGEQLNNRLIEKVLEFGQRYRKEYLESEYSRTGLEQDWWNSLEFFFDHAFYQGRRDDVSTRVKDAAEAVLRENKQLVDGGFLNNDRKVLKEMLDSKIGKGKVGKKRDVAMVVSILEFLSTIPRRNIVAYTVKQIQDSTINSHYWELQNKIAQVGPKVASFYLRDVVSLFELWHEVSDESQEYLQPIDTWVRKLALKAKLAEQGDSDEKIRASIVALCDQENVSPLQFNQGAWYLGYHSFDLLLDLLSEGQG